MVKLVLHSATAINPNSQATGTPFRYDSGVDLANAMGALQIVTNCNVGTGTESIRFYAEGSDDGTTWYPQPIMYASGVGEWIRYRNVTADFTGTVGYVVPQAEYTRVRVKNSGANAATVTVRAWGQ